MVSATPVPGLVSVPLSAGGGSHAIPAIQWGTAVDLTFNSMSGQVVSAGPFSAPLLRLAILPNSYARVVIGPAPATVIPPGTLLIGPEVEFVACTPPAFVSALSNDSNNGTINITPAL